MQQPCGSVCPEHFDETPSYHAGELLEGFEHRQVRLSAAELLYTSPLRLNIGGLPFCIETGDRTENIRNDRGAKYIRVGSKTGGRIERVLVNEGDRVFRLGKSYSRSIARN